MPDASGKYDIGANEKSERGNASGPDHVRARRSAELMDPSIAEIAADAANDLFDLVDDRVFELARSAMESARAAGAHIPARGALHDDRCAQKIFMRLLA